MSNHPLSESDLTTLDREALARMVGELQGERDQLSKRLLEIHTEVGESLPAGLTVSGSPIDALRAMRAEIERLRQLPTPHTDWYGPCDGLGTNGLCSVCEQAFNERDDLQASLAWLVNAVIDNHEIAATPDKEAWLSRAKECGKSWRRNLAEMQESAATWRERAELAEAELDHHRCSAELQEQARKADTCTECKGTGEIGHINQTELGPEGDSSECDACFGSGSQAMADKISGFIEMEYGWLEELCERVALSTGIQRGEFESESNYIESVMAELTAQLAAARAEYYAKLEEANAIICRQENEAICAQLEMMGLSLKTQRLEAENARLRAALAQVGEQIGIVKQYLNNVPIGNLAAIVAASAETPHAVRSNQTRPCCSECNEEKNLVYIQTNAEAEEWLCKRCRQHFQFKPPAEGQEAADGKG